MAASAKQVALYGGALGAALPATFVDVSQLRQVPDHQEVWADAASGASAVVEIVEAQGDVADAAAARYFWEDLAEANGAQGERGWRELPAAAALLPAPFCAPRDGRCGALLACAGWQVLPPSAEAGASGSSASSAAGAGGGGGGGGGSSEGAAQQQPAAAAGAAAPQPAGDSVFVCLAVLRLPGVGSEILVTLNTPPPEAAGAGGAALDAAELERSALARFTALVASLTVRDWTLFQ